MNQVRREIAKIDPQTPVYRDRSMQEWIDNQLIGRRLPMYIALAFGVVALLLSVVGVYGVLAYSVVQRQRELGVRMALGSSTGGVFNIVPRDTISLLTTLHLAEKVTIHVPHPLAYALADLAWSVGLGEAPGGFIDYVRYIFVADGARARRELGFTPQYGSREALVDYLAYRYPGRERTAVRPARAAVR